MTLELEFELRKGLIEFLRHVGLLFDHANLDEPDNCAAL